MAALAAATASMGAAGTPPAAESGTRLVTLRHGGLTREAIVHVPESVAAHPARHVPLVVALHGGLGNAAGFADIAGLVAAADANGFVVAVPQGTPVGVTLPGGGTGYVWNAGRCCGAAARDGVDDVGFLDALVEQLEASLPVDPDRVVMTGHSNGAMMTFRFACERGGVLAAAMPVAGSLETAEPARCTPRGTSLLAVHGDADRNHPIDGGTGSRSVSGVEYRPFAESVSTYATWSRCRPTPSTKTSGVTTVTRYRDCVRRSVVESVVLHGADHPWPGSAPSAIALQGEPFAGWSATDALVDLVAATARRQ